MGTFTDSALDARARSMLDRFDANRYRLLPVADTKTADAYNELMRDAYEPLGFMTDGVLPRSDSDCYQIQYDQKMVAVFRLTEVSERNSYFFSLGHFGNRMEVNPARLIEVNNVVVQKEFRATIVLGLILQACATIAEERKFDYVVGITRQQTLRYFVDFGVTPIDHEPFHVMGRSDVHDFVIYYDLTTDDSRAYMRQRSKRYFHQQYVMRSIQLKYGTGASARRSNEALMEA